MYEFLKKLKVMAFVLIGALVASQLCLPSQETGVLVNTVMAAPEEGTTLSQNETTTVSGETTTGAQIETTTAATSSETTTAEVVKKIVPGAVTGLKAEEISTNGVTLIWKASKNATEYVIYRSVQKKNGKMSKLKKIKTVKTNSFTDSGLAQATKYQYAVYAYRVVKGVKTHSKAVKTTVFTKPVAVEKVVIAKKSAKSVQIEWKKNSKADKYLVYRADEMNNGSLGKYKLLKAVSDSQNTYTDKNLSFGRVYSYKVVVQKVNGTNVSNSDGKSAKTISVLETPKKLQQKRISDTSLKVTWKKVSNASEYEVYRDGKLVKKTKKTSCVDKKLKSGITYEYTVKAVRYYGKKKASSDAACIEANTSNMENGTWVEVSIAKQMMYMYVNGKLYVKTPVVTGNAGALSTTKGVHYVRSKSSPCRLRGSYGSSSWDVTVHYWLGFTADGQGLHDSTWRSAYGGTIYKGNGSHGCVNTPLAAMKKIYNKGYIGMPVIVH